MNQTPSQAVAGSSSSRDDQAAAVDQHDDNPRSKKKQKIMVPRYRNFVGRDVFSSPNYFWQVLLPDDPNSKHQTILKLGERPAPGSPLFKQFFCALLGKSEEQLDEHFTAMGPSFDPCWADFSWLEQFACTAAFQVWQRAFADKADAADLCKHGRLDGIVYMAFRRNQSMDIRAEIAKHYSPAVCRDNITNAPLRPAPVAAQEQDEKQQDVVMAEPEPQQPVTTAPMEVVPDAPAPVPAPQPIAAPVSVPPPAVDVATQPSDVPAAAPSQAEDDTRAAFAEFERIAAEPPAPLANPEGGDEKHTNPVAFNNVPALEQLAACSTTTHTTEDDKQEPAVDSAYYYSDDGEESDDEILSQPTAPATTLAAKVREGLKRIRAGEYEDAAGAIYFFTTSEDENEKANAQAAAASSSSAGVKRKAIRKAPRRDNRTKSAKFLGVSRKTHIGQARKRAGVKRKQPASPPEAVARHASPVLSGPVAALASSSSGASSAPSGFVTQRQLILTRKAQSDEEDEETDVEETPAPLQRKTVLVLKKKAVASDSDSDM